MTWTKTTKEIKCRNHVKESTQLLPAAVSGTQRSFEDIRYYDAMGCKVAHCKRKK